MITSLALTAVLWPSMVSEKCSPSADTIIVGVAEDAHHNFLYCELFSKMDENRYHVDYSKNSKTFATKELDYTINTLTPNVKQTDFRSGERRESQINNQQLQLIYQENSNKKTSTSTLLTKNVDVVDAGFNNFVKQNWDSLESGKNLSINFGSIAHLKTLPLRISSTSTNKCSKKNALVSIQHCFLIDIDNSFLRLLLGNMKIGYDQKHRLTQFDGVVNIQDEFKKSQNAIIHYYYRDDYVSTDAKH